MSIKCVSQRYETDKMVFYRPKLRRGWFASQNIQSHVNLKSIGADNFGVKALRKFRCQIGLADAGSAGNHHIFWIRHKTKTRALRESAGQQRLRSSQIKRPAPYPEFLHRLRPT